jgi:hypothetical protein
MDGKDAIGRAQQRGQTEEDEIHIGQRQDELGVQHDTLVQEVVYDVEQ